MSFVYTLLAVSLFIGILYVRAWRKQNRLSDTTWEQLVRKLEEVPLPGITKVAIDYLQPGKQQFALRADEMWWMIGGSEGLKRMLENAEILIQLAAFAQQWNREESDLVGERMRREGLMLRRAVGNVRRSMLFTHGRTTVPVDLQEAASAYYLIRQRLLTLYKVSHIGRYGRLSIALGNPMAAYGPAL